MVSPFLLSFTTSDRVMIVFIKFTINNYVCKQHVCKQYDKPKKEVGIYSLISFGHRVSWYILSLSTYLIKRFIMTISLVPCIYCNLFIYNSTPDILLQCKLVYNCYGLYWIRVSFDLYLTIRKLPPAFDKLTKVFMSSYILNFSILLFVPATNVRVRVEKLRLSAQYNTLIHRPT